MGDRQKERMLKHEEFKESLVDEVFGKDEGDKVEMEKVTMLIWQFRDDPRVVEFVAKFVGKYSGRRDVFDGIEFYLPQLTHMIIHLEAEWDDSTLERFALVLSQHSMHVALQLNWILQGSIEDYQPETADGLPNPAHNALYYNRCVVLLNNIERCVVYGTPRTHHLQKMYGDGKISKEEYDQLELADRNYVAAVVMDFGGVGSGEHKDVETGLNEIDSHGGYLLYKRRIRRSPYRRKRWKTRYFEVRNSHLYCYNNKGGKLVRAMPLEGANIRPVDGKYPHMFEVVNRNYVYRVRAVSASDQECWIKFLREESDCRSLFTDQHFSGEDSTAAISDMNPYQSARYDFFKGERTFIRDLCNVAERLRMVERDERKQLAPQFADELPIPDKAYLPLCNSTDTWRGVYKVLSKESRVFNTKERCPVLMYLLAKKGEKNLDVAQYLFENLQNQEDDEGDDVIDDDEDHDPNELEPIAEDESPVTEADGETEGHMRKLKEDVTAENGNIKNGVSKTCETSTSKNNVEETDRSVIVWHEDEEDGGAEGKKIPGGISFKGNKYVQKFMRENMLQKIPQKIVARIEERTKSKRHILEMEPGQPSVPIVGSIAEDDAFDNECMRKAKAMVCGGETWQDRTARMLNTAREDGHIDENSDDTVEVQGVFAKSNDDLRQEVFVMQMIHFYKSVFVAEGLPIWLHTYRILSTSKSTGLIEVIRNATSIDGLKKTEGFPIKGGLLEYFRNTYGSDINSPMFRQAQRNFMLSLVGYSLVSYLLGLKDRHNGNIMIDIKGRLIFIDFGFAMGMAPGHEFSFEKAAFKLTNEYVEVMGGRNGECFAEFKDLFVAGFMAARKKSMVARGLVEITMYKSNFPCFTGNRYGNGISLRRFEDRLMLGVKEDRIRRRALSLIDNAINHAGTVLYDKFQYHSNGYIP